MKAMKILALNKAHSEAIQMALFYLSYSWGPWASPNVPQYTEKRCLYANADGRIFYSDIENFYTDENEENILTSTGEFLSLKLVHSPYIEVPRSRMSEVLEAMAIYANAGKPIPWELVFEFTELEEEADYVI